MLVLRSERLHRPLLIACLAAAALFVAALGWEAITAASARREAVESVLRDYAALAAEQYARNVNVTLDYEWCLPELQTIDAAFAAGLPIDAQAQVSGQRDTYRLADVARYVFRLDPADESADVFIEVDARAGASGGQDDREPDPEGSTGATALFREIVLHLARRQEEQGSPYVAFLRGRGDAAEYVVLRRVPSSQGDDADPGAAGPVHGFIADMPTMRAFLTRALGVYALLPATLIDGDDDGDVVQVRVLDPSGNTLFAHGPVDARAESAAYQPAARLGDLRVIASIPASSADRLVVGGLPYSRLPLVAGMLAITLALLGAGVLLWRREQELIRLREQFVAGASHELRTPLAQIRMFAETLQLQRIRSDQEQRHSLEVIVREARRLSLLVENLLRFSSAARGAQHFVAEDLDVGELAEEVVAELEPLAAARGASISLALIADRPFRVRGDRDILRQVLVNLLDNALKYGPEGQTVRVELDATGDHVITSVTDQGPGIPAGERDLVWQRFWRSARTNGITGTGIGLALVRELVELHGGTAAVEATTAGGARFLVTLPRERS